MCKYAGVRIFFNLSFYNFSYKKQLQPWRCLTMLTFSNRHIFKSNSLHTSVQQKIFANLHIRTLMPHPHINLG